MRSAWRAGLAVLMVSVGGCLARHPVAEGELDGYWSLHEVRVSEAAPKGFALGSRLLPTEVVLRQEPSLIRSTISLVRAGERLKAGTPRMVIGISPHYAAIAADMLGKARKSVADLKEIVRPDSEANAERWAETAARAPGGIEEMVRLSPAEDAGGEEEGEEDLLGISATPLLELAIGYLNEQSGGALLADMGPDETTRLRETIVQVFLRMAMKAAGKQDSRELRETVVRSMRSAGDPKTLAETLREPLLRALEEAPPARSGSGTQQTVRAFFSLAPRMLEALETVVRQWDRVESLTLDFRQGDGPLVAATLRVVPGQELRVAGLFMFQPTIVLRGGTRVVIMPKSSETEEVVIAFEPLEDGAAEVRFEGAGYALVRLLALPLADAALREIRVATAGHQQGRSLVSVELLMAATGDGKDPRRVIAFQDVREKRLVRRGVRGRARRIGWSRCSTT